MRINGIDIGDMEVFDFTVDELDPSKFYVRLSDMIELIKKMKDGEDDSVL